MLGVSFIYIASNVLKETRQGETFSRQISVLSNILTGVRVWTAIIRHDVDSNLSSVNELFIRSTPRTLRKSA